MKFEVGNPAEAKQLVEWVANKLMNGENVSVAELKTRAGLKLSLMFGDDVIGWTPDHPRFEAKVYIKRVGRVFKHDVTIVDLVDPVYFCDVNPPEPPKYIGEVDPYEDNMVSHPPHYQSETGLEVIDVIEAFTFDLGGIEATDTGNIIKYMCRWKHKNGLQDLKKAKWYLDHLINHVETLEKENG